MLCEECESDGDYVFALDYRSFIHKTESTYFEDNKLNSSQRFNKDVYILH